MNAPFDVNNITIETKRLILRPFKMDDLDNLFEYASVPGTGEAAGWPHHENKDVSLYRINRFIEGKHTFALVYKENNKVIGSLGLEEMSESFVEKISEFHNLCGREVGYVLSKDYWGQGLMPEAVQAVINYCFNTLNYDFLLCGHFDKNARSSRVQDKCGFVPYRKLIFDTQLGTQEPGVLRLLLNPKKNLKLEYSHPETLIIDK